MSIKPQKTKLKKTGDAEDIIQQYLQAPKGSATERLLAGILKIKFPNAKVPKK